MEEIYNQIINYCGCASKVTLDDIKEAIYLVSLITDWRDSFKDCSTLLFSSRQEVIAVEQKDGNCKYAFRPFFQPYDESTFTFKLINIDLELGGEYNESNEIAYIYDKYSDTFYIELPVTEDEDCECDSNNCGRKYELLVTYDAGYQSLPECVLPVFCDVAELIHSKRKCECENTSSDKEETVTYATGDIITYKLQNEILADIFAKGYKEMLGTISLYEDIEAKPWGVVV